MNIDMEKLVKSYIRIRDAKKALQEKFDSELEHLQQAQDTLSLEIKDRMRALGDVKSLTTQEGQVILSQKVRYYTNDWDSFKKFAQQHDALDLFEKRIAQGNMRTFLEENPGTLPPGLNTDASVEVVVRRPKGK